MTKDVHDQVTGDMIGIKRGRGRPRTVDAETKAKRNAERQKKHREKQRDLSVTVTIKRTLIEELASQMQAIRDGGSAVVLTPEQAGEILRVLRTAEIRQLRSVDNAPAHSPQAV